MDHAEKKAQEVKDPRLLSGIVRRGSEIRLPIEFSSGKRVSRQVVIKDLMLAKPSNEAAKSVGEIRLSGELRSFVEKKEGDKVGKEYIYVDDKNNVLISFNAIVYMGKSASNARIQMQMPPTGYSFFGDPLSPLVRVGTFNTVELTVTHKAPYGEIKTTFVMRKDEPRTVGRTVVCTGLDSDTTPDYSIDVGATLFAYIGNLSLEEKGG